MFDPVRKSKDKLTPEKRAEEFKADKHLVKIGSVKRQNGHTIFKVVDGIVQELEESDYIDKRAQLLFIKSDGSFAYRTNIKIKQGQYITALNKKTAAKKLVK